MCRTVTVAATTCATPVTSMTPSSPHSWPSPALSSFLSSLHTSSTTFPLHTSPRPRRSPTRPAPVIFMGKPPPPEPCPPGMSSFAFMAFAMAVVNAAISTTNNANDNNNNNNNNNNDNNNNLANVNVANANNAANNENMAMAGRRRRGRNSTSSSSLSTPSSLEVEERPERFATAVLVEEGQLVYAPLRIGYDGEKPTNTSPSSSSSSSSSSYLDRLLGGVNTLLGRRKRGAEEEEEEDLEGELSLIALSYIGLVAKEEGREAGREGVEARRWRRGGALCTLEELLGGREGVGGKVQEVLAKRLRRLWGVETHCYLH